MTQIADPKPAFNRQHQRLNQSRCRTLDLRLPSCEKRTLERFMKLKNCQLKDPRRITSASTRSSPRALQQLVHAGRGWPTIGQLNFRGLITFQFNNYHIAMSLISTAQPAFQLAAGLRFQIWGSAFSIFPAFDFVFPFPHSARFRAIFPLPPRKRFSLNVFSNNFEKNAALNFWENLIKIPKNFG